MILAFYSAGAIAVLSAFAYRYALMKDLLPKMMKKRVLIPLGLFHVAYMLPTITFYILSIGDRAAIEKSLIEVKNTLNLVSLEVGVGADHSRFTKINNTQKS